MKTTRFIVSTKNKCAISTNVPISFNYIFITYGESFSFVSFKQFTFCNLCQKYIS